MSQPVGTRDIYYDDSELFKLFDELDEKARRKALRGGFAAAARELKKAALKNYRSVTKEPPTKDSEKGIRAVIAKRYLGYRVTVGSPRLKTAKYLSIPKEDRAEFSKKRRKALAPMWLEGGTEERRTKKTTTFFWMKLDRPGKGHRTGRIKATGFMTKTKAQEVPRQTEILRQNIDKYVKKVAKKHGAKYT